MKSIIVLGGDGMLGHKVFQALKIRFSNTMCTIRGSTSDELFRKIDLFQAVNILDNMDAMPTSELMNILRELRPSIIINCIGVVKQRSQAKELIPSIALNALLPHTLASECAGWGGRLIHFSTDCVFNGKKGGYKEDDISDAEDIYGKTKYLGEVATQNALTLRTSIIGRELKSFKSLLEWFLSQNNSTVKGFNRAIYSGVTTNYLAEVVSNLVENHPNLCGLYQVASKTISKYDLLCELRDAYNLNIEIMSSMEYFCDRSMNDNRFRQTTGYQCPPWPELAAQLANDPTPYDQWKNIK